MSISTVNKNVLLFLRASVYIVIKYIDLDTKCPVYV